MKLLHALLIGALKSGHMQLVLPENINIESIMEKECFKTLEEITEIIKDDTLDDPDCFEKIEEIVCLFESMQIDCGNRHDFG